MKFTRKIFYHGDVRTRTHFAWLPVRSVVGNTVTYRWLEKVAVKETCEYTGIETPKFKWTPIAFVD